MRKGGSVLGNKGKLTTVITVLLIVAIYLYNAWQGEDGGQVLPTLAAVLPTVRVEEPATAVAPPPALPEAEVTAMPLPTPFAPATESPAPSAFDYYVLSLSWSPDYCATNGSNDTQQCSLGKKLAFVLHGLWPQYEKGYPSNCSTQKLPEELKQRFAGLYPSEKLFDHEWEKHGTCSGLEPEAYLAFSQQVKSSVIVPGAYRSPAKPFQSSVQQLKDAFLANNPAMSADGLAVQCSSSGRYLSELRVCFTTSGAPRACSAEVLNAAKKSCKNATFQVRNVR